MLAAVATEPGELVERERSYGFVVKAAGRGILGWVLYVALGTFFSWLQLALLGSTLFRDGAGTLERAGHAGASVLLVLCVMPQFWIALAYALALPVLYALLGQGVALRAALQSVLRERSAGLSELAVRAAFPVCERVAGEKVVSVGAVARAPEQRIDELSAGAMRWLLKRATRAARLPALIAGTDFLAQVRSQPNEARQRLRGRVQSELEARAQGALHLPFLVLLTASLVVSFALRLTQPF